MRFNLNLENDNYKNLETVLNDFAKIDNEYQRQKTEASDKFKVAFEDFMKDFFTLAPQVKQVHWAQYTPYFNDGDACTFSVNEPYFSNFTHRLDDKDEDYNEDNEEENSIEEWEISSWQFRDYEKYGFTENQKNLLEYVSNLIESNDEFLYEIYGDHQAITVTSSGITSDYYEHD